MTLAIGGGNVPGKKRGNLSTDEMVFIDNNIKKYSLNEIAKTLNRTIAPIKRYIRNGEILKVQREKGDDKLLIMLHSRHYWRELVKQFSKVELEFFEYRWIDYFKQFSEDLTSSEETTMVELIRISILINRIMKDKQDIGERVDSLQDLIDVEMKKHEDKINSELVGNMQTQIAGYLASRGSFIKEYDLLTTKMERLAISLKGDRKQRKQKADDSTTSFAGYCRWLDEEGVRDREGMNMATMSVAGDKAREKLGEYFEYADGIVDVPVLNAETAKDN